MSLEVGDDDDDDDFFPSLTMEEEKSRDGGGDGLTQSTLRFEKNEKKLHALPKIPYSQENARQAMVEMVAMDDKSFMKSEHIGFVIFCSVLKPEYAVVGRKTVQKDVMEIFLKSKSFIKSLMKEFGCGMKNLTTDMWSSLLAAGFMCVTVHFISAKWELTHFLLSFSLLSHLNPMTQR